MPHLSKIKDLELNYLSLVLKSSIFWLLMPEEEKLVFSEEPESEKLCWFKNLLITSLKLMVVIQSSPESEKEPEKEMIFITKWLHQELFTLMDLVLDVPWSMDRWTNPLEPELESDLPVLPSLNISEMKKEKMSCCSLIIFSDLLKLVLKCLPC